MFIDGRNFIGKFFVDVYSEYGNLVEFIMLEFYCFLFFLEKEV